MAAAAAAGWLQRLGLLLLSSQRSGSGGSRIGRRQIILRKAASSLGLWSLGQGWCGGSCGTEALNRPGSLDVQPPPPCWRQEEERDQLSSVPSPGNKDGDSDPLPGAAAAAAAASPTLHSRSGEVPPQLLSRLPPEPMASTFPFRRSRGRGCTVRKDEEEARNTSTAAAAAAANGHPAPQGCCPRSCSQALRGALGHSRHCLSSPSPELGRASQRPNSQTSIMAAAS